MNYNTIPIKLATSTEQLVFTATSDIVILGFQVANIHSSALTEFDAFIRRNTVDAYIVKGFNVGTGVSRSPIDQKAKIILIDGDQLYVRINSGAEADVVVSYAVMEGTGSGGLLPVQEGDAGKVMVVKNTENGYRLASIQDVFLTISPSDAGKVVIVNETGTGYTVEDIIIPQELPAITGADEGKFLQVVSGAPQWVTNSLQLPTASAEVLGGVKVGSGLSISEGVLSADFSELPVAAANTLGGVKVGTNLSIDGDGILSSSSYTLPAATAGTRGGVRIGTNISIREGTTDMIDVTLPTASDETLGGVKVGSGLSISEGVLSTTGAAPVDSTPTGSVIAFAGASAPTGWLMCNGDAVSRTTYAALFSTLGSTYGAGDGSTTFNLPDLRGEFVRGLDGGRGVDSGRTLGSAQSGQNASHSHTGSAASAGAHSHTASSSSSGSHSHSGSAASGGSHSHSHDVPWRTTTVPAGSADSVFGANLGSGGTTSTDGAHTHSLSIYSDGAHSHSVTVNSGGAHDHTLTINTSGGTEARPRNIAMNYIIKT